MTTLVESPVPILSPHHLHLSPLPYTLDLSCPIALPSRPLATGSHWPYPMAGPSRIPDEELDDYVHRRYFETLYLPEVFSPLSGFTADLLRIPTSTNVAAVHEARPSSRSLTDTIGPLLLNLPQIEKRHRKVILPLLSVSTSDTDPRTTDLGENERAVLRSALELRVASRLALDEGVVPMPKKLSDELEKREALIQIILLLLYITIAPQPSTQPSKKRKRKNHRAEPESPSLVSPVDDPKTVLELLIDRLSVWQAVADLNIGFSAGLDDLGKGKGNGKEDDGVAALLGRFWKSVMLPFFLPRQPDLCASFHQKVFGHPIPPKLMPATTKKPRKPKLTRAIPSRDDILAPPPLLVEGVRSMSHERERELETRSISRVSSRAGSVAPSDSGSRVSPPVQINGSATMQRTFSKTSDSQSRSQSQTQSQSLFRRSRSRSQSIDPMARVDSISSVRGISNGTKNPLMRNASSGKDLFKSREVGLMRRSTSKRVDSGGTSVGLTREDSQSQSQGRGFGLLGRKPGGGRESQRKYSGDDGQSQSNPNTLILATPSKPRQVGPFGARSKSQSQPQFQSASGFYGWSHPTPIREEPSSASRPPDQPAYIAETPVHHGRMARGIPLGGWERDQEEEEGDGSDDPLGDLWEVTDDEDEEGGGGNGSGRGPMVPETPMR